MKARSFVASIIPAVLLASGSARAEDMKGRVSIAFQAGTQSEVSGNLVNATQGTLLGIPVTIDSKRYRDVYKPDLRLQACLGVGVSERLELILRGTRYKSEAVGVKIGSSASSAVNAFFTPYKENTLELGLRIYIAPQSRLKSYIGPVVGARFLKDTLVSLSMPDASSSISNVPFTKATTVPVFGVDLGFVFDLGSHAFVGVDTGLRYQGAPDQFNQLPELQGIDDSGAQWSAPVVGMLGVRF